MLLATLSRGATAPTTTSDRQELKESAAQALKEMEAQDPGLSPVPGALVRVPVFANVGKGAWIVGGGYGRGIVYRRGAPIGYADIAQATLGLQFGARHSGRRSPSRASATWSGSPQDG